MGPVKLGSPNVYVFVVHIKTKWWGTVQMEYYTDILDYIISSWTKSMSCLELIVHYVSSVVFLILSLKL